MSAEYQPATGLVTPGAVTPGTGNPPEATGDEAASAPLAQPAQDPADLRSALEAVRTEVGKAVIGQDAVLTGLVICLLCRGHVLLEGVPGVAKTLLVRALAEALSLRSTRVQFTPDLMPGDVTGSLIYDAKTALFQFREGPVFTNLLLADEINRTPPKTQAALLEAMQERQVSVEGAPRRLPEAQLDRFLVKLTVLVPGRDDEIGILARHAAGFDPGDLATANIRPVAGKAELDAAAAAVRSVRVAPEVAGYIVDLCRATRQSPSLRHRIQLRPEAELEGASPDGVLEAVLASVPVPR